MSSLSVLSLMAEITDTVARLHSVRAQHERSLASAYEQKLDLLWDRYRRALAEESRCSGRDAAVLPCTASRVLVPLGQEDQGDSLNG